MRYNQVITYYRSVLDIYFVNKDDDPNRLGLPVLASSTGFPSVMRDILNNFFVMTHGFSGLICRV